jgi:uncharacterized protein YjiS (DUF1127 family)
MLRQLPIMLTAADRTIIAKWSAWTMCVTFLICSLVLFLPIFKQPLINNLGAAPIEQTLGSTCAPWDEIAKEAITCKIFSLLCGRLHRSHRNSRVASLHPSSVPNFGQVFGGRMAMVSQAPQCGGRVDETLLVANDTPAAPVSVDRGRWQQSLHALYEGRISPAGREIERCLEVIALWRRRPTERKELLHLVPRSRSTPRTRLGTGATSAPRLQVLRGRIRVVFITAHQITARWRRRVRIRNELITLNDGDLCDIGWTRAEVEAERRKPFWRA